VTNTQTEGKEEVKPKKNSEINAKIHNAEVIDVS